MKRSRATARQSNISLRPAAGKLWISKGSRANGCSRCQKPTMSLPKLTDRPGIFLSKTFAVLCDLGKQRTFRRLELIAFFCVISYSREHSKLRGYSRFQIIVKRIYEIKGMYLNCSNSVVF